MKKLHFVAGTGVRKISYVACGFSFIKIRYSVIRINMTNEVYVVVSGDILLKKLKLHL